MDVDIQLAWREYRISISVLSEKCSLDLNGVIMVRRPSFSRVADMKPLKAVFFLLAINQYAQPSTNLTENITVAPSLDKLPTIGASELPGQLIAPP